MSDASAVILARLHRLFPPVGDLLWPEVMALADLDRLHLALELCGYSPGWRPLIDEAVDTERLLDALLANGASAWLLDHDALDGGAAPRFGDADELRAPTTRALLGNQKALLICDAAPRLAALRREGVHVVVELRPGQEPEGTRDAAAALLARMAARTDALRQRIDAAAQADRAALDALLREGQALAAVRQVQRMTGGSLAEAARLIEELKRGLG